MRRARSLVLLTSVALLASVMAAPSTAVSAAPVQFTILHTNGFPGQVQASGSHTRLAGDAGAVPVQLAETATLPEGDGDGPPAGGPACCWPQAAVMAEVPMITAAARTGTLRMATSHSHRATTASHRATTADGICLCAQRSLDASRLTSVPAAFQHVMPISPNVRSKSP